MRVGRAITFLIILFIVIAIFSFTASGEESFTAMPEEYGDFIGSLPDDVMDDLPDSVISNDPSAVGEGISEMASVDKLLGLLLDGLSGGIRDIFPTLAIALGVMLISAVAGQISIGMGHENLSDFISRICLLCVILGLVYSSIELVSGYFTNLLGMAAAYLPLSAVLYSIGGNVTTAATSSASFGICLSVCQFIFTYTTIPVFVFSLSLAIVSSFYESKIVSSISGAVKKYYTMLLSLTMTVMSVSIGAQTFISAKADNAAMRGVKFVFGNFVPITGGTISSSMGAIASGVELIRGCVGIGGIVIIFIMLAPLICHLLGMKLFFFLLECISGITGNGGVISQISSLYSYLLGIALISSSVFIISFATLASCASAIG